MQAIKKALERELARKQKQLSKVEEEIYIWLNWYTLLHNKYKDTMGQIEKLRKLKQYNKIIELLNKYKEYEQKNQ